MAIPKYDKIKNWYNTLRKSQPRDKAGSSEVSQVPNVQIKEI